MADLVVPQLGESITEAVIAKWLKNVGDAVAVDEPVVDLETDKITVQLPSPVAGALAEQRAAVGSTVRVGDVVGLVSAGAAGLVAPKVAPATPVAAAPAAPVAAAQPAPVAAATAAPAAPKVDDEALMRLRPSQRRAAREHGLPVAAAAPASAPASTKAAPPSMKAAPAPAAGAREEVVTMSPLRKRIAERLVQAQQETASLTTFNEIDMSAVMALRTRYKDAFEKEHGAKLGFMSFFVKACVAACKAWPGVAIVYKKHYDFGIAVSTPRGLIVPVLRDCDTRSFADVEAGILELAGRARDGKLGLDDLTGGTFSITNGGIYGSMMSTPLLNFPQTGILGMHNIVKRAVVIDDQIQIRPMMYVALTYDHRVVDGREAVSFLVAVKERIEAPDRLLLEV